MTQATLGHQQMLTPREQLIRRLTRLLLIGALANGLAAISVAGIAVVSGDNLAFWRGLLLGGSSLSHEATILVVFCLLLANSALLLTLMVGTMAQEWWAFGGGAALVVANSATLLVAGFSLGLVTIGIGVVFCWWAMRDLQAFRINPVALKEVRGRMRGMRAFIIITVYLSLMSAFTVLLYMVQTQVDITAGTAITGELGRTLFGGIVGAELLLIIFIVPAFTAGGITGERERKTYDLLQTTLMSSATFIMGKLESSLSYIVLLLFAAIPLQSIAFLFGGVSETEIILAFVILGATSIALGALGLFFSAWTDRTLTASVRSYAIALAITFGIPILLSPFLSVFNSAVSNVTSGVTTSAVTEALFIYIGLFVASLNPITAALFTQRILIENQQLALFEVTLIDGSRIPLVSPWLLFAMLYLLASAILLALAVRFLNRGAQD